uniref:Jag N-terminal domain-containing protein n=1 Tax=Dialister sp. TaxID=1955814 RepID=UPI00402706A6
MRTVRITAKTIEAAVAEGLEKLGISREEAVVHVVEQPSSGLFGLIHKKMAVVDISAPDEEAPEDTIEEAPAAEIPAEAAKADTPAEEPKAEDAAPAAGGAPAG